MGFYYGSAEIDQATRVRYWQFKHSTLHTDDEWNPSGLERTLRGIAERYRELVARFGSDDHGVTRSIHEGARDLARNIAMTDAISSHAGSRRRTSPTSPTSTAARAIR